MIWEFDAPRDGYRWWFAWYPIEARSADGKWVRIWLQWVQRKIVTTHPTGEWHTYTKQSFYLVGASPVKKWEPK